MKLKKRSSGLMVQLHSSRTNICAPWWIDFLPSILRAFYGSFQQLLMAKELLMGLAVMSNQLFRVSQWAKERTRSLCRIQSLSIKLPAKHWGMVEAYRDTDPFNGCQIVPGIMSMHIISPGDDVVKLWKNASFLQKDEPNIIVNKQHIQEYSCGWLCKNNFRVISRLLCCGPLFKLWWWKWDSVFYWENYFWGKILGSQRKWPRLKRKKWAQESCSYTR